MNLKVLVPVAAIAITSTLSAANSAEAYSVGSSYTISGQGIFSPTSIIFDDGGAIVTSATGDFAIVAPIGTTVTLVDTLDITIPGSGPLVDFVDSDFDFTVETADFLADQRYVFTGFFGDGTPGVGEISPQVLLPGAYSGTFTATAVPTPALLPGLIGMGIAALRKKQGVKSEDS